MFTILIKHVNKGKIVWSVEGIPYEYKVDAENAAKRLAALAPNIFAVVKVETMYQRAVTVTEVEISP